jgi:carbon monoxide dehydrogenase subunit G
MEKVSRKILVNASREKVFAFISKPSNLPRLIPVVASAGPSAAGISATLNVGGMDLPVEFKKVLCKENEGLGLQAEVYGASVEIGVLLRQAGSGTEVEVRLGYDLPASYAAFLPRDYKPRLEAGIDDSLRKLKAELERA